MNYKIKLKIYMIFYVFIICIWSCNIKVLKCKRNLKLFERGNDFMN